MSNFLFKNLLKIADLPLFFLLDLSNFELVGHILIVAIGLEWSLPGWSKNPIPSLCLFGNDFAPAQVALSGGVFVYLENGFKYDIICRNKNLFW